MSRAITVQEAALSCIDGLAGPAYSFGFGGIYLALVCEAESLAEEYDLDVMEVAEAAFAQCSDSVDWGYV